MQLLLVTSRPQAYTARRLQRTARRAGHQLLATPAPMLWLKTTDHAVSVIGPGADADAVHARPGVGDPGHTLALLQALESRGTPALNSAGVLAAVLQADPLVALAGAGVSVCPTVRVGDPNLLRAAVASLGRGRIRLRAETDGGTTSMEASSPAAARAAAAVLLRLGRAVRLQGARGIAVRALVLGGRCVAITQGSGPNVRLVHDRAVAETAAAATGALGLAIAGVDLVSSSTGVRVAGVTTAPALEAAESLSGADLASKYLETWLQLANGPRTKPFSPRRRAGKDEPGPERRSP